MQLNGRDGGGAADRARSRFARNLPVYYLFQAVSGFMIWMPIWMIYMLDGRGMSLTQIGMMEAIFWITVVVAEVPTGAVADRWGRRVSLMLGGFGFALASVLFAFADSFMILTISYLLMGVSMTLFSGAGHALLFDSLRQMGRSNEYEQHVGRSEACSLGAMVLATLLGGLITGMLGYTGTILIGSVTLALGGAVALLLREPPRSEAEFARQDPHLTPGYPDPGQPSVLSNMLRGVQLVRRRRILLWLILFGTVVFAVSEMTEFFLQPFVFEQGIDPQSGAATGFAFSLLIVPPLAAMAVGAFVAHRVAGRFGERRALPVIFMGTALLFVPVIAFDTLGVIAVIAAMAMLRGMIRPIATGYINRRIPSDQRATVLSIYELSMGLVMVLLVPQVGRVADVYDYQTAFALCLAVLLVVGGLFGAIWRFAHAHDQARSGIALNSRRKPQALTTDAQPGIAPAAALPDDIGSTPLS